MEAPSVWEGREADGIDDVNRNWLTCTTFGG